MKEAKLITLLKKIELMKKRSIDYTYGRDPLVPNPSKDLINFSKGETEGYKAVIEAIHALIDKS